MTYFGRGKNKIQDPYTLFDTYEFYINEVDSNSPYTVSKEEYMKICELFYKKLIDYLFIKAGSYTLPFGLGKIYITKNKIKIHDKKSLTIDWKASNEYDKIIYCLNEHSGGYRYKFHWEKKTVITRHKTIYQFILTRSNKRRLAKMIKSGEYDFYEKD